MNTKIKPRRMWVDPNLYSLPGKSFNVLGRQKCYTTDIPVAVIPLHDLTTLGDSMVSALTSLGVLPKPRKGRK